MAETPVIYSRDLSINSLRRSDLSRFDAFNRVTKNLIGLFHFLTERVNNCDRMQNRICLACYRENLWDNITIML